MGLERIAMYIQGVDNVFDLQWNEQLRYGDIFHQQEYENSKYSFETADIAMLHTLFDLYEKEAERQIEEKLVFPAYDYALKCSHTFNLLDARGAIAVSERSHYIARVRDLARDVAKCYLEKREEMGFPLLPAEANKENPKRPLKQAKEEEEKRA